MLHRTPLAGGVPLTPTLLAEREAVVDIIAAVVRHDLFFQKVSALRSPVIVKTDYTRGKAKSVKQTHGNEAQQQPNQHGKHSGNRAREVLIFYTVPNLLY